jgi:malonyl CoA-acyl carrier protein transacylase
MFDIINVNGSSSNSLNNVRCMQIALVDVLRAVGIEPDGTVGHSVGDLGCAYVDGCFTAERTVLAAYYRGRASLETELIRGIMAAVGKFPDVINCNFVVIELPELLLYDD